MTATSASPSQPIPAGYKTRILAFSINQFGHKLITFELTLPRIVLAELNTHNSASKNSGSSRARPIAGVIKSVLSEPFIPVHFGANQSGMQAENELDVEKIELALAVWLRARDNAVASAEELLEIGLHKQLSNRIIEPWQFTTVIYSISDEMLENFLSLRNHIDAQPEIKLTASMMEDLYRNSEPQLLADGEWHLPLIYDEDRVAAAKQFPDDPLALVKISAGRCARVSYLTHDGRRDLAADIELHDRLVASGHMSPTQHMSRSFTDEEWEDVQLMQELLLSRAERREDPSPLIEARLRQLEYMGGLRGFVQYRKLIPNEHNYAKALASQVGA